ncbi:MAG: hypothetical protein J6Y48_12660 [Clostridia bacterium]|nr:hypothetical protein [Clostridia bacterium]
MAQIFVNQKYHKNGNWTNNVHVKEADTVDSAVMLALHQFHAFMSTYAYGQDIGVDYASCSVEDTDGILLKQEVDNRLSAPISEA